MESFIPNHATFDFPPRARGSFPGAPVTVRPAQDCNGKKGPREAEARASSRVARVVNAEVDPRDRHCRHDDPRETEDDELVKPGLEMPAGDDCPAHEDRCRGERVTAWIRVPVRTDEMIHHWRAFPLDETFQDGRPAHRSERRSEHEE